MVEGNEMALGWIDNQFFHTAEYFPKQGALAISTQVSRFTEGDCAKAIQSSQTAFQNWRQTSASHRAHIFEKAATLLDTEFRSRFEKVYSSESAIHPAFLALNVNRAISVLREAATLGLDSGNFQVVDDDGVHKVNLVPWGVVLSIVPWNAAIILSTRALAAPIMAGNAVVMKTSEFTPRTHLLLGELFKAAGLPDGVLNIVHVAPQDASSLLPFMIDHPNIRKINFTGSDRVGRILAARAGAQLKPILLELGGKAAGIICSDADLGVAANNMLFGALANEGQICMSTERVLVMDDVYDAFKAELLACAKTAAEAQGKSAAQPGMISVEAAKRILQLHNETVADGAKSLLPIDYPKTAASHCIPPAIYENVPAKARIQTEEIFGPMLMLQRIHTVQEGIDAINSLPYGLTASVFTRDTTFGEQVAAKLDIGGVHINSATFGDAPSVPHGGWKSSGYGRFNGKLGYLEWVQTQAVSVHNIHRIPLA